MSEPDTVETLQKRIARERRARADAEAIAERATADLYAVAERQRAILESVGDAILATASDGAIVLSNPAAANLLRLRGNELLGTRLHELLHPPAAMAEPCDTSGCSLLEAMREGHSRFNEETTIHRADGSTFPASYTFASIAQGGRPAGSVLTLRDHTLRKQAEATRIKMASQMDEMKRLQEIDTFRTNFINMAAHELRTPLTPIRTELFLLKQGVDSMSEDQRHSLEILNRGFERLGRLVEDVLEGARMQAGRLGIRREAIDLARVVRDVTDSFSNTLQQRGISLETTLDSTIPLVGDAGRLTQVVTNLLNNAIKFTPRNGKILVNARRTSDLATVVVRDSGIGLEPGDIEKLFRPFSQATSHAKANQDGAGLGLYICRGIVELHGGRIWAESAGRNQGASFTFAIPAHEAPRAATSTAQKDIVAGIGGQQSA